VTVQFRDNYLGSAGPTPVNAIPVTPAHRLYRQFAKRLMDICLVLMVVPPVALVLCVLAVIIALDGRSPFYFQERVGLNGRVFRMVKLRTMVWNADAAMVAHLAADPKARAEWNRDQKLKQDPRITRFGAILRRSSLDELPQLWNVLVGDMSIVGPRPMMCNQKELYPGTEYYAMRPGITGFWQISARNESSFPERAMFDRSYFQKLSFGTDVSVMFRTVGVMMRGTGY